jgi:putative transposase
MEKGMPRKPRFYLPGVPAHLIQRGNDRQPVFFDSDDNLAYLWWLKEACDRHGCAIHAYVLMTNHVHLLLTPETKESIGRVFQDIGRHYVGYFNRRYGRSGTLWEGRHKGSLISNTNYFLLCSRYIELNPVRAGMVRSPDLYPWSSYKTNALGERSNLLTPHDLYSRLGASPDARQKAYRDLFRQSLAADSIENIRSAVQTGTPLGSARFKQQIEERLKQKVGQTRRGRPAKGTDPF